MRHWQWYGILLLVVVLGDRLAGTYLQRQADLSGFRYARLYAGAAQADVLLIGNSRGLVLYQPFIEQISGLKTFNLSYNGLPADAMAVLTADYLDRYPAPRKMVIDITLCDRRNDPLLAGFMLYARHSPRLDSLLRQKAPKAWWGGQLSQLFRCNNELFQRALYYRNRPDDDWLLDRTIPEALAAEAVRQSYRIDPDPYLVEQLAATVRAARQKGVAVELIIGPYFPGFRVDGLDALKSAVERAAGLPLRDYRSALPLSEQFGDFMHPNKSGSRAFIDMLHRDGVFD